MEMLEKAEQWRVTHGARFEPAKYILVHYTRRRAAENTTPIQITDTLIQPSQEARYLGVIFDKHLRFKLYMQKERLEVCARNVSQCPKYMEFHLPRNSETLHIGNSSKNRLRCDYMT